MLTFEIRNYRRVERATLAVENIAVVGAPNGNGKTSLAQAMGTLLTGEKVPPGLPLKLSETGALVRSGAPDALLKAGKEGGEASMVYPKNDFKSAGTPPQASRFAVGLVSVLGLGDKECATTLARYLKSEPTAEDVLNAIEQAQIVPANGEAKEPANADEANAMAALDMEPTNPYDLRLYRYFAAVWSKVHRDGWDRALKDAKDYGTKQKGAWEMVTGEKGYQPTGGDTWRPKHEDWDDELLNTSIDTLEAEVTEARAALESEIAKGAVDKSVVERLQEEADAYNLAEHNKAKTTLAQYEAEIAKEEAHLAGLPQPEDTPVLVDCPHCGVESQLITEPGKPPRLQAEIVGLSAEENEARRAAIAKAKDVLTRHKGTAESYRKMVERWQETKRTADAAKVKLDELLAAPDNSDAIEEARTTLRAAQNKLELKQKKDAADKAHRNVQTNQRLIDILSPDGLRKKKVLDVVEAFNNSILAPLCEAAGWDLVTIDEGMGFRLGGWPYALLAESHQFMVRVALQFAMAKLDGSELVVIDGADILLRKPRIGLFKMAAHAGIPTIVLSSAEAPEKLPQLFKTPGGTVYWMENGQLRQVTGLGADGKAVFAEPQQGRAA